MQILVAIGAMAMLLAAAVWWSPLACDWLSEVLARRGRALKAARALYRGIWHDRSKR